MTNIRTNLSAAADRLFTSFSSVTKASVYHRITQGAYDPVTGTSADTTTDTPCSVILESWSQNQIDGTIIKAGDRKALVRGSEFGFEPSADDSITIAGVEWSIKDYSTDPAGIVYSLHVRAAQ